ncbi:Ku protein [Streptomyces hundungensis]|uniref:Ku protein n=1 Tax=Streptomyces hundungensis TaxID=1077946 RepID=UPI00341064BE
MRGPCRSPGPRRGKGHHTTAFHQVHIADAARVRTEKLCETDGQQHGRDDVGKGYDFSRDTIIRGTNSELNSMPLPTSKTIGIVTSVLAGTRGLWNSRK